MHLVKRLLVIAASLAGLLGIALVATLMYFGAQVGVREVMSAEDLAPRDGRLVAITDPAPNGGALKLHIQEMGPPQGQPVVMVHGTGAWSEAWKPTMRVLAAAGFRAIAIDLPPFGLSQRPGAPVYDKATQGRRIAALLQALKLERAILVGHSFGGGPTMEAALHQPALVRGIVLVDAALGVDPANESRTAYPPAGSLPGAVLGTPWLRDRVAATFLTNPLFTRRLLTLFIDDPRHATDDWVAVYRQPLSVIGSNAAISQWLPELLAPARVAASERPSTYKSLKTPLCLIWGDLDSITPLAQARALIELSPSTRIEVLPGVGHIPQIEAGEKFNNTLVDVLRFISRP